jgi:hypothetical protein
MHDQLSDLNLSKLYAINTLYDIPDFVKEAAWHSREDFNEVPSTAFADPANRVYPINTRAATWLSAAYFDEFTGGYTQKQAADVQSRLSEALHFWGLVPMNKTAEDLDEMAEDVIGPEKTVVDAMADLDDPDEKRALLAEMRQEKESRDHHYRIVYDMKGTVHAETPVRTAEEMTKVASDLVDNRHKYPYEMRCSVSRQIIGAPEGLRREIGPTVENQLNKMAGLGLATLADTMEVMRYRCATYQKQFPELTEKLASARNHIADSEEKGIIPPNMLIKVAGLLDSMDRLAGLHQMWGQNGYQAPEDQLFRFTQKDADDFREKAITLSNGQAVLRNDLMATDAGGFLGDFFGEKYASQQELFDKVASLESREADLLIEYMQEVELSV